MTEGKYDIVVIGGSAGSISVVSAIIDHLPKSISVPVIVILHRQRNVSSEMAKIFQSRNKGIKVVEPEDKEPILAGYVYLAPQNYHLLVEHDRTFSLDYSEQVHFSRPSIDVTFESVAKIYGDGAVAVLLSGANKDGTRGSELILKHNGKLIVQDPDTAEYPVMVRSAIEKCKNAVVNKPDEIIKFIANISTTNE
jgi:two-component system chemotaxis response regulator CheB